MASIQFFESTLFGDAAVGPSSLGEATIGAHILQDWRDIKGRSEWCAESLPRTGNLLLEEEDQLLLQECRVAYIFGLYAVAIIAADAFLGRVITDVVEARQEKSGNFGFGKTLAAFKRLKIFDPFVVSRVERLHKIRNNFAHERGPDDGMRLFRRTMTRQMPTECLIKEDAKEAICLSYGLAGKLPRNFPRLDLPGERTFFQSPLKF